MWLRIVFARGSRRSEGGWMRFHCIRRSAQKAQIYIILLTNNLTPGIHTAMSSVGDALVIMATCS